MRNFLKGFGEFFDEAYRDLPTAKQVGFGAGVVVVLVTVVAGIFGIVVTIAPFPPPALKPSPSRGQIEWERLDGGSNQDIYRIKTPDGWLVRCNDKLEYIPDSEHRWKLEGK